MTSRKGTQSMKEYFFIEGFKAKTGYEYEDTLSLVDEKAYPTEEKAAEKAKQYLEKDSDLSLIIIYKGLKLAPKEGVRYIHRNEDNQTEEIFNWW